MRLLWRLLVVGGLALAAGALLVGLLPRGVRGNGRSCGTLLNPHIGCESIVAQGGAWPIFWVLALLTFVAFGSAFVIWLTERERQNST